MATSVGVLAPRRKIEPRTKTKTGCVTCRIRKVKCDENKPSCKRCVNTGRACDGYESPFIVHTSQSIKTAHIGTTTPSAGLRLLRPTAAFFEITHKNIELFNRYFSTKTLFNVDLGCDEEAREVLQASLTNSSIRHALLSLRALREDLETSGDCLTPLSQQSWSYHYGLQQYGMALGGLASNLSCPSSNGLHSALLCCQIFISIEQVRKNYAAMAQHIIRGLRIMHEYRARPTFVNADKLVLAHPSQLPCLDVFVIKLFAAPCKFADSPETEKFSGPVSSLRFISRINKESIATRDHRTIEPDMRTELTRIAMSTMEFLGKASEVESIETAHQLLSEKVALMDSLESWLIALEIVQTETRPSRPEPISSSFLRLFYRILKVVLLGALNSSPDLYTELQTENAKLQSIANGITERVMTYITCNGISNRQAVVSEHAP